MFPLSNVVSLTPTLLLEYKSALVIRGEMDLSLSLLLPNPIITGPLNKVYHCH